MSKNCEKLSSQFPRAESNVFKLYLSSNQQLKTQRLFFTFINDKANIHIYEPGTRLFFRLIVAALT